MYGDSTFLAEDDEDGDIAIDDEQLGPEVDSFAQHIDLYRRHHGDDQEGAAIDLINEFRKDTAEHYSDALRRKINYLGNRDDEILDLIAETDFYKMESETWDLVGRLLPGRNTPFGTGSSRQVGDYESNEILRRQLLKESSVFRELNIIRDWLRSIAPEPEIPNEGAEDEETMASGHMYTFHALKDYKTKHMDPSEYVRKGANVRFEYPERGIPEPEDKSTFIATEMDPDGPLRQERKVATGDHYYDSTFYRALWGYIRRGDFKPAAEWCRKCGQSWRAPVVLGGRDEVDWLIDEDVTDDPIYDASSEQGLSGNRRRQLWRRACYALAKRPDNAPGDLWEKAAYGLLAGDIETAIPACSDWHDHIYTQVNALIEAHYESYLQQHGRIPNGVFLLPISDAVTMLGSNNVVARIVDSLSKPDDHRFVAAHAALGAMRAVQGSIISDRIPKLVGVFADQLREFRVNPAYEPEKDTNTPVDCTDWKVLRVVAHIIIILQHLGQWPEIGPDAEAAQEVIAGYIRMLAAAGKYNVIPLYAARLSHARCVEVMGEVLLHVDGDTMRDDMIRSFNNYGLDIVSTLRRTMDNAFVQTAESYNHDELPIQVLSEFSLAWNARKKVEPEDEHLIKTAEWMLLVDGMKTDLIKAGVMMFKRFYLTGRLDAARELTKRIPSRDLIPDEEGGNDDLPADIQAVASVYIEYELLIEGLDALDSWNQSLAQAATLKREGGQASLRRAKTRDELQAAYEHAQDRLGVLVNSWLVQCENHEDAAMVKHIRNTYIPDITMALHGVHLAAGHNLNKSFYSRCFELAVLVAKPSSGVAETFVATGRMAKYVDELAKVSLLCLQASKGMAKEPNAWKSAEGTIAIWNVKPVVKEQRPE
ncbi:hypothetical protein ABW19_dt0210403 [Dactylella cylindrospora]|nr:hypothetical protein ABW19_dt0210403 [Dactylella cylindrospora]